MYLEGNLDILEIKLQCHVHVFHDKICQFLAESRDLELNII